MDFKVCDVNDNNFFNLLRKKQKIHKKKQRQRTYKGFISIVKWHKTKFDTIPYISNICENESKKEEVRSLR